MNRISSFFIKVALRATVLVCCSANCLAVTHTIGATVPGTASKSANATGSIPRLGPAWYIVCYGVNSDNVTITTSYGSLKCNNQKFYVTGGVPSPLVFSIVASNPSTNKASISAYIGCDSCDKSLAYIGLFDVPAASVCSADISDVELGQLSRGQEGSSQLTVTKSGTGMSVITFTGDDLGSDGVVHLGGTSSGVTVAPVGGYVSGASWVSDGSHSAIPLTLRVSSAAATGALKSVLSAKLSCN